MHLNGNKQDSSALIDVLPDGSHLFVSCVLSDGWCGWRTHACGLKDAIKTSLTISPDWFRPLPGGGRGRSAPTGTCVTDCASGIILKTTFSPGRLCYLSSFLSSFSFSLTVTNTLYMIDGIVSNHTSLAPIVGFGSILNTPIFLWCVSNSKNFRF